MTVLATDLAKQLAVLNAGGGAGEVDGFRNGLWAMAVQLQSDETAAALSLAQWWDWLDQEGYERQPFAAALRQIAQACLEPSQWAQLQAEVQTMQTNPEGLPALCHHVLEHYPALAGVMEQLQASAMAEQELLEATAGGGRKWDAFVSFWSSLFRRNISNNRPEPIIAEQVEGLDRQVKLVEFVVHDEISKTELLVHRDIDHEVDRSERLLHQEVTNDEYWSAQVLKDNKEQLWDDLNKRLKNLELSNGVRLEPLMESEQGIKTYIFSRDGRQIVRVIVEGQSIVFYRSSGEAGKDQIDWPKHHWYPVNGIGTDNWINKTDASPRHYGSKTLKTVADELKKFSDSEQFKEAVLNDWNILAGDDAKFNEYINKGLDHMVEYETDDDGHNKMEKEMLRRVAPVLIKERYPKAYGYLSKTKIMEILNTTALGNDELLENHRQYMVWGKTTMREKNRSNIVDAYEKFLDEHIHPYPQLSDKEKWDLIEKKATLAEKILLSVDDPFLVFKELHNKLSKVEQKLTDQAVAKAADVVHHEENLLITSVTQKVHQSEQQLIRDVEHNEENRVKATVKQFENQIVEEGKNELKDARRKGVRTLENIEVETKQTIEVEERSAARDL